MRAGERGDVSGLLSGLSAADDVFSWRKFCLSNLWKLTRAARRPRLNAATVSPTVLTTKHIHSAVLAPEIMLKDAGRLRYRVSSCRVEKWQNKNEKRRNNKEKEKKRRI
jgi:hypothetical protein